jgi:site-specific DNA recombinase
MNKLAAIYARVSSDRQKEDKTIASQTTSLREYAHGQGYTVPPEWVFEDEGYSGATLARPGLERLRDLVAEGQVQTVLSVRKCGRCCATQRMRAERPLEKPNVRSADE